MMQGELHQSNSSARFFNRAEAVPEDKWEKLDATKCIRSSKDDDPDWMRRAPYALLIGAMKGGTSALNEYLQEHSMVVETSRKELHFYDFRFGDRMMSEHGIIRSEAVEKYRKVYQKVVPDIENFILNEKMIAIDDSPRYLFWSDRIPNRVVCVSPWVKILAVLRNPIDRAFSHYNMKLNNERHDVDLSFEEWVARDFRDLRETGVVQDKLPLAEFRGSQEEARAWKAYTRLGTHAPIGRGLYAIQLRQWFEAFRRANKPLDDVLVIQSEAMRKDPAGVYKNVLKFLGLPNEPLLDKEEKLVGEYHSSIKNETRRMLEEFYAPYNQELYDIIGDGWEGVWDSKYSL